MSQFRPTFRQQNYISNEGVKIPEGIYEEVKRKFNDWEKRRGFVSEDSDKGIKHKGRILPIRPSDID